MYLAKCYTEANSPQRRVAKHISDEFEDELGEISGRCLDVGTGPGDVLIDFVLPKLDPRATIVCSDISESMLKFCKEKYGDNERLSFEKLNIQTLDLPKHLIGQFDIVTSFYCLHWCWNIRQAFENIFIMLRPGGTCLVTLVANHPLYDVYPVLAAVPRYRPYMKDCDCFIPVFQYNPQPRKALKTMLQNIGFEIPHCSCRSMNHRFKNQDTLKEFLRPLNPFTDRFPPDIKEKFQNDLFEEILKRMIVNNKENNVEKSYSILATHQLYVAYLRKPENP